uniref:Tetratricopeptide repeat protein n=1 Tax=Eiseniibacteriota bacterium TaxID=2212470 RepID=A0A832I4S4_UNCEI
MRGRRLGAAAATAAAVILVVAAAAAQAPGRPSSRAARAARPVPESLQVLARIGTETLTRGDVQRRLEELPEQFRGNYTTPEGRRQLLDRMIEERVWLDASRRAGVPDRPQVKRQLEQSRRDLYIRTHLNEVMAALPQPGDSAARAHYEAHKAEYTVPATVTLRHIQLKSESDAKRVLQLARNPREDWSKLAQRWSLDSLTRASGGQLGTVTREGLFASLGRQPALAESAFALGEGRTGGPWRTDRGWHVVRVDAVKPESVRPFDQVRSMILRQLQSQASSDFYQARLAEARRTANVRTDDAAIEAFVHQKKSARDLFKEAQEAGPAATRIELYRRLLAEHPDSEVSPQAQFMIGFIQSEELKDHDAAEASFRTLLERYPKSELAASAKWMIEHMRTEDAPGFMNLEADSAAATPAAPKGTKRVP